MTAVVPALAFERINDAPEEFRGRSGIVRFLELPDRRAVMIDGTGPPGPSAFTPRMPGLYGAAYGLHFALKRRGVVTKVRPLEGLWWTSSGETALASIFDGDRDDWRWRLLIVLPDEATDEEARAALAAARAKLDSSIAPDLRLGELREGRVAQVLHVGPYASEAATIERLHAAVADAGLRLRGKHHEIYLGDPGRTAPERLRTLLRHPVE